MMKFLLSFFLFWDILSLAANLLTAQYMWAAVDLFCVGMMMVLIYKHWKDVI